jgi:hypothetical protein
MAVAALATCPASAGAAGFGSIQSSDVIGTTNINQYTNLTDIYLNGGGGGQILDAGFCADVVGNQNLTTQVTKVGPFNRSAAQGGNIEGLFNVLSGRHSPNAAAGDTGGSGVTLTGSNSSTGMYEIAVYQPSTDVNANFAAPIEFRGAVRLLKQDGLLQGSEPARGPERPGQIHRSRSKRRSRAGQHGAPGPRRPAAARRPVPTPRVTDHDTLASESLDWRGPAWASPFFAGLPQASPIAVPPTPPFRPSAAR